MEGTRCGTDSPGCVSIGEVGSLESGLKDVVHDFLPVRTSLQAEEIDLGYKPPRDSGDMALPEEEDVVGENDHGLDTGDKVHAREVLDVSYT